LTLLNPSGGVADTSGQVCDTTSIGLANAPDVLTVPGTYTVRLELDQTATGSAKLWVSAPVTAGTVRVNGPAVSMNVTRVGQGVQRTFTGKAGQRISTVVTNLVTSDNPGCATLTLLNPSGGVADTSGQVCDTTSIGIGPDRLHVSGTYTVRLELDQTATGRGSLKVST
jgi:ribosomal protein S27E